MAMSVGGGRRGGGFTEINVTPLVDVMLVLLIVFMITAPLLATSLKIELPNVQAAETPLKDTKLVVSITADEKIIFSDPEEHDVTANVEQELLADKRIQKEKELYIRADGGARYKVVARVVAAARKAGVEGLNLLVQPELEEENAEKVTPVPEKTATPGATSKPGPVKKKK